MQVLPLAHEYQSTLVADCENFMIKMCKPKSGVTVSLLLDYILAGEKYGLTRFLDAAVEFCAKIDYQRLSGKSNNTFIAIPSWAMTCTSETTEDNPISWKFSNIGLKTQFAIAEKRLSLFETNHTFSSRQSDHSIPLS